MTLLAFAQALATFIEGPFAISFVTFAIAACALGAALGAMRWSHVFEAVACGAILFSAAWIVTTFLQGGGGV